MADIATHSNKRPGGRRIARRSLFVAIGASLAATSLAAPADARLLPLFGNDSKPAAELGSMYSVVDQIGARTLWERGVTGEGVNVAVIDTGVAPVEALSGPDKVIAMVDLSAEAGVPEAEYLDTYGHGTHMTGIIAGRTPGADPATSEDHPEWFLGVAPDAGIVSVKVGDNTGAVDVSQVIAGIDWVVEFQDELDISVLNLSFGSDSLHTYLTDPLTHAVERAWAAGIVVVVAAGNDGLGIGLSSPATDPDVITVGGLRALSNTRYEIPDWASNGNIVLRNPDIGAPGAHIQSLRSPGSRADVEHPEGRVDDQLFLGSGSSQAAAVTSGAAALLLSERPWLTNDQVKDLLKRSANTRSVPWLTQIYRGHGALRVDTASRLSPRSGRQYNLPALGTGTLDGARGTASLSIAGIELSGEVSIVGGDWTGARWTGARWTAGEWDGARWTGGEWRGARWTDATWTGARWTGARWTGADWAGARWTGEEWTGSSWSGARWTGARWTGTEWSGARWTGTRWMSTTWS
jgi:serine protease AprX